MKSFHPYLGRTFVMATKHEKERILRPILASHLGVNVELAEAVDTDCLGTFSGEITRQGTPLETAIKKARLGIQATGIPIGIANEGSFGPHPQMPFFNSDQELLVLVDIERDIVIEEYVVSASTNVGEIKVSTMDQAEDFLANCKFGSHALVVRPNSSFSSDKIQKGILDRQALARVVQYCATHSADGLAHIETDMRAHLNPTRQNVIAEAGEKFARRIKSLCSECGNPGWGVVDCIMGLPCETCRSPTQLIHKEIEGCVKCAFRKVLPRSDGKANAPTHLCPACNP